MPTSGISVGVMLREVLYAGQPVQFTVLPVGMDFTHPNKPYPGKL
jgi:hypothetical protein